MDTLETLDLVNRTDDGWGLTLEPWWAPRQTGSALTRQPERWRPATRSFPTSPERSGGALGTGERAGVARRHRYIRCRPPFDLGRQPTVDELIEAIPHSTSGPRRSPPTGRRILATIPYHPMIRPLSPSFQTPLRKLELPLPPYDPGCATATIGVETDHEQQPLA